LEGRRPQAPALRRLNPEPDGPGYWSKTFLMSPTFF